MGNRQAVPVHCAVREEFKFAFCKEPGKRGSPHCSSGLAGASPTPDKSVSRVQAFINFKLLGFAIVSMAVVLGVAVNQLLLTREFIGSLSHSHQMDLDFRMARTYLLDAETAQRGFILTGKDEYLEPWVRTEKEFGSHMLRLKESTWQKPSQAARFEELRTIAAAKLEEVRATIELHRKAGFESALNSVSTNVGKVLMDRARAIVNEALQEEARLQQELQEGQIRGIWVTTFLIITSALLCLAAGINAFSLFRKALQATRLQRRALIARRRAMNSDREKNLFMANMSHEIRTPMNAIIGFSQLLREEVESPLASHYVNAIATAGENLLSLINDVLDISKIEAGKVELRPEVIDLREVVQNLQLTLSQRASAKGLQLLTEVAEDLPAWLLLDPLRLRQMLMNLLGNAIKFTAAGHVSLKVHADMQPGNTDSVTLIMAVEDTGRGIAPGDLELIFRPFRQGTQQSTEIVEGTGLGLSITRKLVNLMRGKVTVASHVGTGSKFTIRLPDVKVAMLGPQISGQDADAVSLDTLPPMKVLIVDDNAHNREVMGAFFLHTHHEVEYATNGMEAVEQAIKTTPDLILMDIRMPRLDGRDATELLRRHDALSRTPVIAVTASSLGDSRSNARAVFDGYLRKPFLRPELVNVIRHAVASTAVPEGDFPNASLTGPALPLSGEAAAQLRQLHAQRWPILTRTMAVRAIRSFADELEILANAHSCPSLRDYAATLKHEAATFQISRMEKSLDDFPALVENLAPLSSPAP